MKLLFIIFTLQIFVWQSKSQTINKIETKVKLDSAIVQIDSIENLFDKGEYFMTSFIRLNKKGSEFMYITDDYIKNNIKDKKIVDLYLNTSSLTKYNREEFYSKIISHLPKEDIEIHKKVWNIKEVKNQGKGGNGGRYTLATWIIEKPTLENPFYSIEIRRNYYNHFGICMEIGFVKINSKTKEIFINDIESGEYLPINKWRRLKSESVN